MIISTHPMRVKMKWKGKAYLPRVRHNGVTKMAKHAHKKPGVVRTKTRALEYSQRMERIDAFLSAAKAKRDLEKGDVPELQN